MTSALIDIAIFYGGGAAIFGTLIATMDDVSFTYKGRDVACPRLVAGVLAGVIWPFTFWQIVVAPFRRVP